MAVDAFIKTAPAAVLARLRIAFGLCDPKVECWVLNAFDPTLPKVAELCSELGFNPSTHAHLLVGGPGSKTSAKKILAQTELVSSPSDWVEVLERVSIGALALRGEETGLRQFLHLTRCNLGLLVAPYVAPCDWCTCWEE